MKGKELLKDHDTDAAKMLKHMLYVKEQIRVLKEYIPKKGKQLVDFEAELKGLEGMTLTEWIKAHS